MEKVRDREGGKRDNKEDQMEGEEIKGVVT